jgi:hypothetical protein
MLVAQLLPLIICTRVFSMYSIWVESGITIRKVRDVYLFKCTDALQARLDHLVERKKSDILSAEGEAELTGLLELDRIFTLLNAKIIDES